MSVHHLIFLYDPLCGWCYGALPGILALADMNRCIVEPLPTGLFAGDPTKRVTEEMARHIQAADVRITEMSGQRFTDKYRREVLGNPKMPFDSSQANRALTAVSRWDVERELDALSALQRERFVAGRDISDLDVIAKAFAATLGEDAATWRERITAPQLERSNEVRMARARKAMKSIGINGTPGLLWPSDKGLRLLPTNWLFSHNTQRSLASQLACLDDDAYEAPESESS